jgi:hypothetical protein
MWFCVLLQISTNACQTEHTNAASTPRASTFRATIHVSVSPDISATGSTVAVGYQACRPVWKTT